MATIDILLNSPQHIRFCRYSSDLDLSKIIQFGTMMKVTMIKKTPVANAMRKVLLYTLLKHSNRRFANLSNDKAGWKKVLEEFNLKTGLNYTGDMLTTQCVRLKKNLGYFEKYKNVSGFGMDSREVVTGAPEALNAYYAENPKAVQFSDAPLPFYEEILELFGSKCESDCGVKRATCWLRKRKGKTG